MCTVGTVWLSRRLQSAQNLCGLRVNFLFRKRLRQQILPPRLRYEQVKQTGVCSVYNKLTVAVIAKAVVILKDGDGLRPLLIAMVYPPVPIL